LSQNTTDPNALQAYENILEQFSSPDPDTDDGPGLPRNEDGSIDSVKLRMSQVADTLPTPDWAAVQKAPSEVLEDCISVCGLQQSKAATIQRVLDWLDERDGNYDLASVINDNDAYEAARKLAEIKGIGIKTAAVTLMEADRMDVCPVDTHVHRICQRLRLVEETSSRKKTFRDLQELLPEGKGHSFHHNLLTFGRTVCTARNPDCENCFLRNICHYYRNEDGSDDMTLKFANN
ncbi:MAG: endonuclease III, partial [bacterium]